MSKKSSNGFKRNINFDRKNKFFNASNKLQYNKKNNMSYIKQKRPRKK